MVGGWGVPAGTLAMTLNTIVASILTVSLIF